jgi:hypothetical protein
MAFLARISSKILGLTDLNAREYKQFFVRYLKRKHGKEICKCLHLSSGCLSTQTMPPKFNGAPSKKALYGKGITAQLTFC